jgi:hypothetical protein
MRPLRALALRLLGLFRAHRADADFSAELESNVALHTDDLIRAGLTPCRSPPPGPHPSRRRRANPPGSSRAPHPALA